MYKGTMKFGLHPSPKDNRDFLVCNFLEKQKIPDKFSIRDEMSPVISQGQEGSCAGQAGDGIKEYQEMVEYGSFHDFSSRFLYERAKKISGHKEGTTLRAICKVLKDDGICYEEEWPYIPNSVGEPKPTALETAYQYRIESFGRITSLDELKESIFSLGAVLIGIEVFKGMISEDCKKTGIVPEPTCFQRPLGGHALVACGYDDNMSYWKNPGGVIVKNSWGKKYGDEGFNFLSYNFIKKHMIDAYSLVDVKIDDHIKTVMDLAKYDRDNVWRRGLA